ncbi:MAG: YraN family protein [Clostridia bacterium]|nr:YraN family protein [Clostridia bacterium]
MKTERRQLGDFGEKAAALFLKKQRYRILERNFICGHHEVDLVVEDAEHLIFVEVKTRTYNEHHIEKYGSAGAAVTRQKQRNLIAAARNYLNDYKKCRRIRFDVIEVYVSKDDPSVIQNIHHMTDAFRP